LTWQGGDLQICIKDLQFLLIPFLFLFSAPNENPPLPSPALAAASSPAPAPLPFPALATAGLPCSRATAFPCSRRWPPLLPRRPPLLSRRLPCSGPCSRADAFPALAAAGLPCSRAAAFPCSCRPPLLWPLPDSHALAAVLPCSARHRGPPLIRAADLPARSRDHCPLTSPASSPGLPHSADLDGADCGGPGGLRQAPGRHGRPYSYGPG
jgi:hypothetical protein